MEIVGMIGFIIMLAGVMMLDANTLIALILIGVGLIMMLPLVVISNQ